MFAVAKRNRTSRDLHETLNGPMLSSQVYAISSSVTIINFVSLLTGSLRYE